jgi:hypothetical protein
VSPDFDELVGDEARGAERERLRGVHDLLVQAGPPAELTPQLQQGPDLRVVRLRQRRVVKRRAMLLLAAALSIAVVFFAGYSVANHRGGSQNAVQPPLTLSLKGTSLAPNAHATLEVWHERSGNWPMTLSVAGLPQQPHTFYDVYLVRNGQPWAQCGKFRVTSSSGALTLTLNAPYPLQTGDSWIVTRQTAGGGEPGTTVLRPVSA